MKKISTFKCNEENIDIVYNTLAKSEYVSNNKDIELRKSDKGVEVWKVDNE